MELHKQRIIARSYKRHQQNIPQKMGIQTSLKLTKYKSKFASTVTIIDRGDRINVKNQK